MNIPVKSVASKVVSSYNKATQALQNYGYNSAKATPPVRSASGKVTKDYYGSTKFLNPFKAESYKGH